MENKIFFTIYLGWIFTVSLVTFIMYGIDKRKAQKNKWRISEKTLLVSGIIGGAAGGFAGMQFFRHKTKHWYFGAVNIFGIILHCAGGVWIFLNT